MHVFLAVLIWLCGAFSSVSAAKTSDIATRVGYVIGVALNVVTGLALMNVL